MTEEEVTKTVPPLGTLYFYLTGDCNMACRHCWIVSSNRKNEKGKYTPLLWSKVFAEKALELLSISKL